MLNSRSKWVLLISTLLLLLAVGGFFKLSFTNDFRVFFADDSAQLRAMDEFENTFSKQENILIVVEAVAGDLLNTQSLTMVRDLSESAWQTPHSSRVSSLANYQYLQTQDDDITVVDALPSGRVIESADIQQLERIIDKDRDSLQTLLSKKNDITIIEIQLSLPAGDLFASTTSVKYVRELISSYAEDTEHTFHLAGYATSNVALGEAAALDVQTLVPLTYLLIIIGLVLWLRSLVLVACVLAVVTLTVVISIGLIGWIDPQLTPILGYVPSVIMIIAIADAMHLLISYRLNINAGQTVKVAMDQSVMDNRVPIIITSISTIIGFLALNFNDSPPYQQLGNIVAIGVAVAWFLSLYVLPILVRRFGRQQTPKALFGQQFLLYIEGFVSRYTRLILFGAVVTTLAAVVLASQNRFTDHWYHYFGHSFDIRQAIEVLDTKHVGVDIMEYQLKADNVENIFAAQYVRDVEKLRQWFKQQANVTEVMDFATVIKKLNRDLHDPTVVEQGDHTTDAYVVPDSNELIAQYFLLYEMSLPLGLGTDSLVDINRQSSRLTVLLHKIDAQSLLNLNDAAKQWMQDNTSTLVPADATGLDMVMSDLNISNIQNMIISTLVAMLLIGLTLFFVLKNVYLGCVAFMTNIVPALLTYASCYLLFGTIDLASSMVICMSLGIIVDDTVHFLYKYKTKFTQTMDYQQSISYAFKTSGTAILITTLVLLSGFIVQGFSDFQPTAKVGFLMAFTFVYALIVDLIWLPCVLKLLAKKTQGAMKM